MTTLTRPPAIAEESLDRLAGGRGMTCAPAIAEEAANRSAGG
jgi:hypothetical protein